MNDQEFSKLLNAVQAMLGEGVPTDLVIEKLGEHGPAVYTRLAEHLSIVYENVVDGSKIPEDIVDDDGTYRRMRESDKITRASIENLMAEIKRRLDQQAAEKDEQ